MPPRFSVYISETENNTMATLKLNIYADDKKSIAKTYEAEGYDLMLGTLQDIFAIIDPDKINGMNETEMAKMAVRAFEQIAPILRDVFPGVTNEELRNTKTRELVPLFVDLAREAIGTLRPLKQGN